MNFQKQQQGAALFVGMIFLLVLTILTLTAAKVSTLDERMAGNYLRREQAYQDADKAQNDAARYVALCRIDGCPTPPSNMLADQRGNLIWNSLEETMTEVVPDEVRLLDFITSPTGANVGTVTAGPVLDSRSGTIVTALDIQGGLMGLEPGSVNAPDYHRITSYSRKGDLSGGPEARASDAVRQMIFVP